VVDKTRAVEAAKVKAVGRGNLFYKVTVKVGGCEGWGGGGEEWRGMTRHAGVAACL
jgi:hypothetical protein